MAVSAADAAHSMKNKRAGEHRFSAVLLRDLVIVREVPLVSQCLLDTLEVGHDDAASFPRLGTLPSHGGGSMRVRGEREGEREEWTGSEARATYRAGDLRTPQPSVRAASAFDPVQVHTMTRESEIGTRPYAFPEERPFLRRCGSVESQHGRGESTLVSPPQSRLLRLNKVTSLVRGLWETVKVLTRREALRRGSRRESSAGTRTQGESRFTLYTYKSIPAHTSIPPAVMQRTRAVMLGTRLVSTRHSCPPGDPAREPDRKSCTVDEDDDDEELAWQDVDDEDDDDQEGEVDETVDDDDDDDAPDSNTAEKDRILLKFLREVVKPEVIAALKEGSKVRPLSPSLVIYVTGLS